MATTKAAKRYYEMYVIAQTQYFHGKERRRLLEDGISGRIMRFATPKEARAYIEELERNVYCFVPGEYQRPTYRVCRIDRLPQYLAEMLY